MNGFSWIVRSRVIAFGIGLLVFCYQPLPGHASGEDWVRVKRFNDQLKLAESGRASAMYEVGHMYEQGRGVEQNAKQAVYWYERAIDGGSELASTRLGAMYYFAQGIPQDLGQAYKHISKAAQAKVPLAQFYLGLMYEEGKAIKKDYRKALYWYEAAAKSGYYDAKQRINAMKKAISQAEATFPATVTAEKPVAKAKPTSKPANGLIHTVLSGNWHYKGRPAGYLPSEQTECQIKGRHNIECESKPLTRNTGDAQITYVTEAQLSRFNQQQFKVSYYNNVKKIEKTSQPTTAADATEPAANSPLIGVQLGKQSMQHHLDCTLADTGKLSCIKNRSRSLEFTNVARDR